MPGDSPEDAFPPAPPTPPGLVCPCCGDNRWRVWFTTPRKRRIDRWRRCKSCGLVVRTAEYFVSRAPGSPRPGRRGGTQFIRRFEGDGPPPP